MVDGLHGLMMMRGVQEGLGVGLMWAHVYQEASGEVEKVMNWMGAGVEGCPLWWCVYHPTEYVVGWIFWKMGWRG